MALDGQADTDVHQHLLHESQVPMDRQHQKIAMPFHEWGTSPPILLGAENTGLPVLWMVGSPVGQLWTDGLLWEHIQVTLPSVWCIPGLSVHMHPRGLWEKKDTNISIGGWRCPGTCSQRSPWLH